MVGHWGGGTQYYVLLTMLTLELEKLYACISGDNNNINKAASVTDGSTVSVIIEKDVS